MPYEFKFPDVGEGITEGEVVKWRVKEGDAIKEHDVIVEIETDKAVVEIPSPRTGTIGNILHKAGDTVKVGETLCTILEAGEKPGAAPTPALAAAPPETSPAKAPPTKPEKPPAKPEKPPAKAPPKPAATEKGAAVVGELEEAPAEEKLCPHGKIPNMCPICSKAAAPAAAPQVLAIPAVRRLARELGVDLSKVKGTGLGGRITEEDVRKAAPAAAPKEAAPKEAPKKAEVAVVKKREYDLYGYIERVPVKGVRKVTARKMRESISHAAHVTHMEEADVTILAAHREKEKAGAEAKGVHLTYLPFIVKAVVAALKEHPYLNAQYDEEHDEIMLKKYYNIGIAVDTPDGLIVPVVKGADQKPILQLAKEIDGLAEKAAKRQLDLAELKGGTFTITNIGVFGGTYATPIINYPEVAILGLGRIKDKAAVDENGKIVVRKILPMSLSFDHRVLDGAEAARFTNDVKKRLEDPDLLLVEG